MRTRPRLSPIEAGLIALGVVLAAVLMAGVVVPVLHQIAAVTHAIGGRP